MGVSLRPGPPTPAPPAHPEPLCSPVFPGVQLQGDGESPDGLSVLAHLGCLDAVAWGGDTGWSVRTWGGTAPLAQPL